MTPTDTDSPLDRAERFDIEIEEPDACRRRLRISVDGSHVARVRRSEAKKLAGKVRIQGFRKGKVPPHIVEERYGPAIDERTVNALVNEGFREAAREHSLETVGEPAVEDVRYEPGERLEFTVDVEVMPRIEIGRTGGFRIKRPEVSVSEDDVNELLEEMRAEHAVLEPVDRRPEAGDVVSVQIRPASESDAPEKKTPYRFELEAGYALPDVERAIRELSPGEAGTFDVTYPDDFGDEELAGRTRSLHIELAEVKAKRLPELDDELAREIGDFDTLEELRAMVREDLRRHAEEEADKAVRNRLLDSLLEANDFEVPRALVSRYLDRVLDVPEDADPERVRKARESVAPTLERQIKRDLILERLIEMKEFEAGEEELEARLAQIGERNDLSADEVRKRLAREKRLDDVRREIVVRKAFDFLRGESTVA